MPGIYKKRIRLKNFDYIGTYRYFITMCAFDKKPLFKDFSLVSELTEILREQSVICRFKIWAWCFMPNHLHILIEGSGAESDMKHFISAYKQTTGFYYKKRTGCQLWQINFYEHILRKEEDTTDVARYIFGNPVRKGLTEDYKRFGSFEFDTTQL